MKQLKILLLLSFISLICLGQEPQPAIPLQAVNAQFYVKITGSGSTADTAIWHFKGAPYGWERLAKFKDIKKKVDSLAAVKANDNAVVKLAGSGQTIDQQLIFRNVFLYGVDGSNVGHWSINANNGYATYQNVKVANTPVDPTDVLRKKDVPDSATIASNYAKKQGYHRRSILFGDSISGAISSDTSLRVDMLNTHVGTGTITGGRPRLIIGTNAPSTDDSRILLTAQLTGSGLFSHGIRDESVISATSSSAYASFDSAPLFNGSAPFNHMRGFQFRGNYGSSGNMALMQGLFTTGIISGTGIVANFDGAYIDDITYSNTGTVTNQTGVHIAAQTKGTNTNYAIKTEGTTPSVFGGNVSIGGGIDASSVYSSSSVFAITSVTSASVTTGSANIGAGGQGVIIAPYVGGGGTAISPFGTPPTTTNYLQYYSPTLGISNNPVTNIIAVNGNPIATATGTSFTITKPISAPNIKTLDANGNMNWTKKTITAAGNDLILNDAGTQWVWRHDIPSIDSPATLTTDGSGNRSFTETLTGNPIP